MRGRPLGAPFHERHMPEPNTGCWLWLGPSKGYGYGGHGSDYAHRVSYRLFKGPIPDGLTIDHLCSQRSCVNPAHLEAVPMRTNLLRGNGAAGRNARKDACPLGHPYDRVWDGTRRCSICRARVKRASKDRVRARTLQ